MVRKLSLLFAGVLMGASAMSLQGLLKSSDVVTVHVPLLDATRNLIGATELALMKRWGMLDDGEMPEPNIKAKVLAKRAGTIL